MSSTLKSIKSIVVKLPFLVDIILSIQKLPTYDFFHKRLRIKSLGGGYVRLHKFIKGRNNYMEIGRNCNLYGTSIHVVGNNNKIIFNDGCIVGKNCSFWMEGDNITIIVGASTTFTHTVHFCAQENNSTIVVEEDCMFSNNIIVRTSDSHPIYDIITQERINPAKNVFIGKHVWIAPNSKIMKGAKIGDNSIVGSNTIVTNDVPENSLVVGAPYKIVKSNINWTRESLF